MLSGSLDRPDWRTRITMTPEIIDLFSGCGGLALGFERAGFDITHGVELMPEAVKNIAYNMSWRYGRETGHIEGDITKMEPEVFASDIGPDGCIVIGGPPCQAYSLAGRAKLRSLGEGKEHTKDARGYLYQDFLRFVHGLNAKAAVMENVPESVAYDGKCIPQTVCDLLAEQGYIARWSILNSANYGVPQVRERVIVIALRTDLNVNANDVFCNIAPTNRAPDGFVTANEVRMKGFDKYPGFVPPPKPSDDLPEWVTVGEALSDLPVLFPSYSSKYIARKLNAELAYSSEPQNAFQKMMRDWYGERTETVTGNFFRNNARDFPIFAMMEQGANYIDASELADSLVAKEIEMGSLREDDEALVESLRRDMVPVYDRTKFESKWKRLSSDKPSHTLVAHLGKDTYSHIHPTEPRGISVREAARLQSFPDDYFFSCSSGDAYRQIGNAVPVLLAYAVAKAIKEVFD